jgi:predicted Zn-ribbon and HTH transcriptional regulator
MGLAEDEKGAVLKALEQKADLTPEEIVEMLNKNPESPLALDVKAVRKFLKSRTAGLLVKSAAEGPKEGSGESPVVGSNEVDTP